MTAAEKLRQEGRQEGEKRGEMKKAVETAKKMLKARLQIKQIAEFTGLSIEDIEELKKEMK